MNQDPTQVLDELARQTEALLGCDGASIHLAERRDGELYFRRTRLSDLGRQRGVAAGSVWRASPGIMGTLLAGRVWFVTDFHRESADDAVGLPWLREIASALYAPLIAADELLGVLFAAWLQPRAEDEELVSAADALARCAGVAVHTSRLLAEAHRARSELEAIFDAAEDFIFIVAPDGRLRHVNRRVRERLVPFFGSMPTTVAELFRRAQPFNEAGAPMNEEVLGHALGGAARDGVMLVRGPTGGMHRLHVQAAPIVDPAGQVHGSVVIARNITQLHDAIAESARLDGAIKTARLIAHQLNNQLSPVRGYGELLSQMVDGEPAALAGRMARAAEAASTTIAQLQRIIRFEQTDLAGYTMLNLEAATEAPTGEAEVRSRSD